MMSPSNYNPRPTWIYRVTALNTIHVICYLIGLCTSINFFIEVFGRAFNVLLAKRYVLSFDLNITVESIDRIW